METNNSYKYLSIVLAIIAIVFAFLYFTKPNDTITETLGDISADFQECSTKLSMWRQTHGPTITITAEARAELDAILDKCRATTEDSEEKI